LLKRCVRSVRSRSADASPAEDAFEYFGCGGGLGCAGGARVATSSGALSDEEESENDDVRVRS
jgi:hypothetical protein